MRRLWGHKGIMSREREARCFLICFYVVWTKIIIHPHEHEHELVHRLKFVIFFKMTFKKVPFIFRLILI